ncbi:MAG: pyridoxamine 5'-phosphate oxidase family protein [Candidatus Omnitrophota bacterium]
MKDIEEILSKREFVYVATADFDGRPNVAPKFLLKVEDKYIYLADHVIGRTWQNLKINTRVSLSVSDRDTLTGHQINGAVEVIDKGPLYEKLLRELKDKQINLSVTRIIEGIQRGAKHRDFELTFPERVIFFKVKIEEIVEIRAAGQLNRQKF